MKRELLYVLFILFTLLIVACAPQPTVLEDDIESEVVEETIEETEPELVEEVIIEDTDEVVATNWRDWELTDVNTGETFKVSDFAGTPVLLESFAVWCPTCTKQQRNTKEFEEMYGETLAVSISIDTDPNEDEQQVIDHTNFNDFTWRYAIAPSDLTEMLIDEFGLVVVSAPSVPIILVCEDQSARLMTGLKKADVLKSEVEAGC